MFLISPNISSFLVVFQNKIFVDEFIKMLFFIAYMSCSMTRSPWPLNPILALEFIVNSFYTWQPLGKEGRKNSPALNRALGIRETKKTCHSLCWSHRTARFN